jgi:hypothetical protein
MHARFVGLIKVFCLEPLLANIAKHCQGGGAYQGMMVFLKADTGGHLAFVGDIALHR